MFCSEKYLSDSNEDSTNLDDLNNLYAKCSNFEYSIVPRPCQIKTMLSIMDIVAHEEYQYVDHRVGMDLVNMKCRRSGCFTKGYSQCMFKTGSFIREDDGRIRLFTSLEVQALMGFPSWYKFPSHFAKKTKYRLLGNSINVQVVNHLIKHLLKL
ncbi:hypothetical protein ACOME3_003034 [Neoechinorhynchus agilis]